MDLNIDYDLVKSQKLLLTPQLRQALEVLGMSCDELYRYVEQQLESNPVLDLEEDTGAEHFEEYLAAMEAEQLSEPDNNGNFDGQEDEGYNQSTEFAPDVQANRLTLKEYLTIQLNSTSFDEEQMIIGEYLIGNTDEDGYLTVNLQEVAAFFNTPVRKVTEVLERLQDFDPPGVLARNLRECLILQLKQMKEVDSVTINVVDNYLSELADNNISVVSENTGIEKSEVAEIFKLIKTLEPRPGREFYQGSCMGCDLPDVIVRRIGDSFKVLLNEDVLPLVNINKYYIKLVNTDISGEARVFIQGRINNAIWLMKCIEHRKQLLRKITECIVSRQREFFQKGKKYLKNLDVNTVANETGLHPSMVRYTSERKNVQCCWGIFELDFFII